MSSDQPPKTDSTFDTQLAPIESQPELIEIRARLRRVETRDWWLWGTAVVIMLLLALAVTALALPALVQDQTSSFAANLGIAIRALLGLVLLFSVFVIYQQTLIKGFRSDIANQIGKMAALHTQAEIFQKLAILDPLTALYNQRFATEHLPTEIARSQRYGFPLTLLLLNIGGMKKINDLHGNAVGDAVIKEFSKHLKKAIRSSDLPVRMAGDQFMVLLPECREEEVPLALSRLSGLEIDTPAGYKIPLTYAAGWVQHQSTETSQQLLQRLDNALHIDKCTGGAGERVRQVEALQQQERRIKLVGRLAHEIVNDFNDLLMVIKGYVVEVKDSAKHDSALQGKVLEIENAAERASLLSRQLLTFSRRQVMNPQPVSLNDVVSGMEMMLRRVLGRQIALVLMCEPGLDRVMADSSQLEQIVMHLAANAREAMPAGGRLTLETANVELNQRYVSTHPGSRAGNFVRLAATDSGEGLDAETLNHIFDPLFASKTEAKGLGLANVYGSVKQLGGYTWVDSEVGRGTTVTVYLPSRQEVPTQAETAPSRDHSEAAHSASPFDRGTVTVLLLEPAHALRKLLSEFLDSQGCKVIQAETGAEALQLAEEQPGPIHVAVLNLVLAEMNCREVADHLISLRPQTRVLYVANYADTNELVADGTAIIRKPFTPADLSERIRDLLEVDRPAPTAV
jgi:diguanylate cyclase (GGDEF)-like protein